MIQQIRTATTMAITAGPDANVRSIAARGPMAYLLLAGAGFGLGLQLRIASQKI